jgi:hypothetical protein
MLVVEIQTLSMRLDAGRALGPLPPPGRGGVGLARRSQRLLLLQCVTIVRNLQHLRALSQLEFAHTTIARDLAAVPVLKRALLRLVRGTRRCVVMRVNRFGPWHERWGLVEQARCLSHGDVDRILRWLILQFGWPEEVVV